VAVAISCISAAAIGLSNFFEDALDFQGLGSVWVIGILALFAGLLAAGLSAFWVKGFSPLVGGLLLVGAAGLLFITSFGWFGLGLALLALGLGNIRS
jgi:hypothetical protein